MKVGGADRTPRTLEQEADDVARLRPVSLGPLCLIRSSELRSITAAVLIGYRLRKQRSRLTCTCQPCTRRAAAASCLHIPGTPRLGLPLLENRRKELRRTAPAAGVEGDDADLLAGRGRQESSPARSEPHHGTQHDDRAPTARGRSSRPRSQATSGTSTGRGSRNTHRPMNSSTVPIDVRSPNPQSSAATRSAAARYPQARNAATLQRSVVRNKDRMY